MTIHLNAKQLREYNDRSAVAGGLHKMFHTTQALVLREVRYKEADRILTLFSASDGKITAKARGALRKSSRTAAATQQLTYAEMTLFGNRGKWTVNEASLIEPFTGLRNDIERFSLGSYFAECMEAFSGEDQPDPALLQLGLNCLYALSQGKQDPLLIKAAFETRLMAIAGYEPDLNGCCICGRADPVDPILCLDDGGICCRACRTASLGSGVQLDEHALAALRYVISAPPKQLLAFRLEGESLQLFADAAERYLLLHAERSFSTLDYWKKIRL